LPAGRQRYVECQRRWSHRTNLPNRGRWWAWGIWYPWRWQLWGSGDVAIRRPGLRSSRKCRYGQCVSGSASRASIRNESRGDPCGRSKGPSRCRCNGDERGGLLPTIWQSLQRHRHQQPQERFWGGGWPSMTCVPTVCGSLDEVRKEFQLRLLGTSYQPWYPCQSRNNTPQPRLQSSIAMGSKWPESDHRWEHRWRGRRSTNGYAYTSWLWLWGSRWCEVSSDRRICSGLAPMISPSVRVVRRGIQAWRPGSRQLVDWRAWWME